MTKTKEGCRLCLTKLKPKTLTSLFQSASGIIYSDMVERIADVKISQDDGLPDKLCHTCRQQVKELYDFKLLIESSDRSLRGILHPKKISFSNISDVKLALTQVKSEKPSYEDLKEKFAFDDKENMIYNDIVIKKFVPPKVNNLMLIDDFLDSIDDEYGDEEQYTGHTIYKDDTVETDYGPTSEDETNDPEELPLAIRKVIKKNEERARRLERRRLRVEAEDEEWLMPAQGYTKTGCKKIKYPKELGVAKRERFVPPLTKTNIKPEVWSNICLLASMPKKKETSELCPHCGLKPKNFESHLLTHSGEKRFQCDQCPNRSYYTKAGLIHHLNTHKNERAYKCKLCTAAFNRHGDLTNHQKCHNDEKKYKCSVCDKTFKWRAVFLRHEKSHNAANKNVMCEMCNMSFFTKYGLRHHIRIHTGERPFKCELCNQPYSYKHDFNRHCMNKHGVFLKRRRDVKVLNQEVLEREQEITRGLVMRAHGIIQEGEPLNPFENDGVHGAMAFSQAIRDIQSGKVPIQLDLHTVEG